MYLKCKLSFGLPVLLKGPEEEKGINAVKQSLSGAKMPLLEGCEVLPFGKSVPTDVPTALREASRSCGAARGCSSAQTSTEARLGIAVSLQ